jgi:hypothetical protein
MIGVQYFLRNFNLEFERGRYYSYMLYDLYDPLSKCDYFHNTEMIGFGLVYGVKRHFQQYFSYIVAVSFIGGGNQSTRRKPPTCRESHCSQQTKLFNF